MSEFDAALHPHPAVLGVGELDGDVVGHVPGLNDPDGREVRLELGDRIDRDRHRTHFIPLSIPILFNLNHDPCFYVANSAFTFVVLFASFACLTSEILFHFPLFLGLILIFFILLREAD